MPQGSLAATFSQTSTHAKSAAGRRVRTRPFSKQVKKEFREGPMTLSQRPLRAREDTMTLSLMPTRVRERHEKGRQRFLTSPYAHASGAKKDCF
jgi:hypothetical protein